LKRIKNLVSVIGCPRSGTSILYMFLSNSEKLWSLYAETPFWPVISPESEVLTAGDATYSGVEQIVKAFCDRAHNYEGNEDEKEIRIVEKQPKTCLAVDYINRAFPGAYFVYITRDGRNVIHSLMDAWHKNPMIGWEPAEIRLELIDGSYAPTWWGPRPPGWQNYTRGRLVDACAMMWVELNQYARRSLSKIDPGRVLTVRYEDLSTDPERAMGEICRCLDIPFSISVKKSIIDNIYRPEPEAWKKGPYREQIESVLDRIKATMALLGYSL